MRGPRLHASSWLVGLISLTVCIVIVVPGEQFFPHDPFRWSGGPIEIDQFDHGWPLTYMRRAYLVDFHQAERRQLRAPWLTKSGWNFYLRDEIRIDGVNNIRYGALAADAAAALLISSLLAASWEWRRRKRRGVFRFTLFDALATTALVCGCAGWAVNRGDQYDVDQAALQSLEEQGDWVNTTAVGPVWLRRLVGAQTFPQWFERVDEVHLHRNTPGALGRWANWIGDKVNKRPPSSDAPGSFPFKELRLLEHLVALSFDRGSIIDEQTAADIGMLTRLRFLALPVEPPPSPEVVRVIAKSLPNCKLVDDIPWDLSNP